MSSRYEQAQAKAVAEWAQVSGSDKFNMFVAKNVLAQYAIDFQLALEKFLNERQVVGSGKLRDSINPEFKDDETGFTISMLDYFDYPNEGVAGVRSNKNAQGSPYKFKNYGMNADGRTNIKEYILSGRAKVSDKTKTKIAVGLERKKISGGKKKSLIDMQVDELIYLIKRYGIKRTDYFNDAFETVFANFSEDMAKAYGKDVALNLRLISSKNK
jgi:predicted HTH domain antitoxin